MVAESKCRRLRHLSREVSKVPTLSQGTAVSQSKALLSSTSCHGLCMTSATSTPTADTPTTVRIGRYSTVFTTKPDISRIID